MILQRSLALHAICASAWLVTACGGGDDRSTSSPTDSANIAPTVELSGPSQVVEGDDVLVSASADDPDGTITRFDWTVSSGTVAPQSPSSTRHEYRFRAPDVSQPETIELTATVVDDAGASASAVYNVTVLDNDDPAEAPEVSAGADRSVEEASTLELVGTATAKGGRSIRELEWAQLSGPTAEVDGATDQNILRLTLPQVAEDTPLSFRLTATDSAGVQGTDTVRVTVLDVVANALPIVDAGSGQTVTAGDEVTLRGTAGDPDGSIAELRWEPRFTDPAIELLGVDTLEAVFTAPNFSEQTELNFALVAIDNEGGRAEDMTVVTVLPIANTPPSIDSALADPATAFSGDNAALRAQASDADADPIALSWNQVEDAAPRVAIRDANTADAGITLPKLDEQTAFQFDITASDGIDSASRTVTLQATAREEAEPNPLSCLFNPLQPGCPLAPAADLLDPAAFALCAAGPLTPGCPFSELIIADPQLLACLTDLDPDGCIGLLTSLTDPSYLLERIPPDAPANTCTPLYDAASFEPYIGAVHEHTGYSDGTINTRPADVFAKVAERGYDFAFSTEHSDNTRLPLTVTGDCASAQLLECVIADDDNPVDSFFKWQATAEQAAAATTDAFTALRGFEWTSDRFGHINVLFSRNVINAKTTSGYAVSMTEFWQWLLYPAQFGGGADGLISFNHPGREDDIEGILDPIGGDPAYTFNDFRFVPGADYRTVGLEVFGKGSEYDSGGPGGSWLAYALDKGWHVGAVSSEDHHGTDWGASNLPKTVLIARSVAADDLREAMLARRMYAVAQRYDDLRIGFTIDGAPMGARLRRPAGSELALEAWVERGGTALPAVIELVTAGNTTMMQSETANLAVDVTVPDAERYVFLRIKDAETGRPIAFSSPIWLMPGNEPLPACEGPAPQSNGLL